MIVDAPIPTLTAAAWRADLQHMAWEMEKQHKNLFHTISRDQFTQAVADLDARIPVLARHRVIVELARLVARIGDAHTTMYLRFYDPAVRFRHYPLNLWLLEDVLFVRASAAEHLHALGAPVLRIGNLPAQEALDRVRGLVAAENEQRVKVWGPALLVVPEVLHACGISDSPAETVLTVAIDGAPTPLRLTPADAEVDVPLIDAADRAPVPRPLWLRDSENAFWFEYLAEAQTVYLQYNAVRDKPDETLADFFGRVFAFTATRPVTRFVIDLRANGGGNNTLNWPLIYGLIRSGALNQRGRLFTIIGRRTFSAAMNCANALEQHTHTLFVGEPTGASPNHYGDAARIVLPHSGLAVFASTLYWQDSTPTDTRPWIAPQIPVPLTRADYLANRDPVLDAILRYQ